MTAFQWRALIAALFVAIVSTEGVVAWDRTHNAPAAPPRRPDLSAADGQRADIAYLRRVAKVEGAFSPAERAAFDRETNQLAAQAGRLEPTRFELAVSHAVALSQNGHSNAHGSARGRGANALPLRVLAFRDGLFVVKAAPAYADLLGAQVLTIGGRTPQALAPTLDSYVGGTATYKAQFEPFLLESPAALHAMGLLPDAGGAELTLKLADGQTVSRRIPATPGPIVSGDLDRRPQRDLSPMPILGETGAWTHVLRAPAPLYLAHLDRQYWSTTLPSGALYVQINRTRDAGPVPLEAFLQGVLATAARTQPPAVILDLRFNTGGNYDLALPFTRDLPKQLAATSPIYILTTANTFSAAIVTAARLKAFGGGRTFVAGEPVGDDLRFWAEGESVVLPYSGLKVRYSNAYHDWAQGCGLADVARCYWKTYLYRAAAGTLAPDLPVSLGFGDYVRGADPVLEAVERDSRQRRTPKGTR